MNKKDIIDDANKSLSELVESPMDVKSFIDELINNPQIVRDAHTYLLDAIEYYGKRKVFENGEEKSRYIFFDDPENNGEHAVLGHTEELNNFVNDLRVLVNSKHRIQKIFLFTGPTATGKSEFKRCIINGVKEYSKTEHGKRYTIQWNDSFVKSNNSGLTYGDISKIDTSEKYWYDNPVQINPISIFPKSTKTKLDKSLDVSIPMNIKLDPFSQKTYDNIKNYYTNKNNNNLFSDITDENHLRIKRYIMSETNGIGVLNAEDDGSVKERLLGVWMPTMFESVESIGMKNPHAFNYDGVLSQGNSGISIVEDATHHADLLIHLLNIPDEEYAKIDKKIRFDIDTVPIFIANPDLIEQKLLIKSPTKIDKVHGSDPLKAIKRRINTYNLKYLTSFELESKLIKKELSIENDTKMFTINSTEFSPHVIEAVSLYNVISRLDKDIDDNINLVQKALLLDKEHIKTKNGIKSIDEFDIKYNSSDGKFGIPVTYTRYIINSIAYDSDEENKNIYLPHEVLNKLNNNISEEIVFGSKEIETFRSNLNQIKKHILHKQEQNIINSILFNRKATKETIDKYIDAVYNWDTDDEEYDKLFLKEFEIKYFRFDESNYGGSVPGDTVIEFRQSEIIQPLNNWIWEQKNKGYKIEDINIKDSPVISNIIKTHDWKDVFRQHPNLSPSDWESPQKSTETKIVKEDCIDLLVDEFGYTHQSAVKMTNYVFKKQKDKLNNIKNNIN